MISDGIAAANILGDLLTDGKYRFELAGQKAFAATDAGDAFHDSWISVGIARIEDADGVNGCRRLLDEPHHIRRAVAAAIVTAVTDDDQRLFVAAARFQMLERERDRI